MSKTIPIWCAVLNRAVARVRASSPGVFQSTNRKPLETIRGTDAAGGSTRSSAPLQEINSSGGLVLSTASSTDPSVGLSRRMYRQPSLDSWLDDERSSHKRTTQQPCNGFHNAPLHSAGASCAQHLDANACNAAVEAGDSTVVVTLDMNCLLSVAEGEGEILSVSYGGSHAGLLHANSGLEILEDESVGFACEPALECVELDLLMRPSSNAWSVPTTPTCITAREHHSPGPNRQCASSLASTCVLSSSSESSTAGAGSPSQTGMASFISCGTAHSTIRMALDTDNGIELRPHSAEDLIAWDAECPPPIPIAQPVFLSPPILEGSASDCGSCGSRRNIKDTAAAAAAPVHQTACEAAIPWDTGVHLPLWVGASEGRQIESRLEGWVDALMSVGEGLVKQLARVSRT